MGGKGIPDEMTIDADVDVNATVNATMDTVSDMTMDTTMDTTMRFPDTMRTEMDTTMRFPDTMRTEMALTEPIRTEMAITEPIRTDMTMDMAMDVKPVVLDLCVNLGINELPPTCIKRPYRHRLAIEVMGNEIAAVSLSGQRDVIVDSLDKRPAVAWGTDHGVRNPESPRSPRPAGAPLVVPASPSAPGGGGLRINLGD